MLWTFSSVNWQVLLLLCWDGLSIWNRLYRNRCIYYLVIVFLLPDTPPPPPDQYTHPHTHTVTTDSLPLSELQSLITSNERRMAELKSLSMQLQQTCSTPCKDAVEVQTITGTGRKKIIINEWMTKAQAVCIAQEVSQLCPIWTFVLVHYLVWRRSIWCKVSMCLICADLLCRLFSQHST